jgi:hypothetical protein
LQDSVTLLAFYFRRPPVDRELLASHHLADYQPFLRSLIEQIKPLLANPEQAVHLMQSLCKQQSVPMRHVFTLLRIALSGNPQGIGIKELITLLGPQESYNRLATLISS